MPVVIVVFDDDARLLIGKFMDSLPASTARCTSPSVVLTAARNCNRNDALAAGRDHCPDSTGLGTAALRISGVFNIAADMNLAIFIEEGGTNMKIRVGTVSFFSDDTCGLQKFFVGHRVIRPYASGCLGASSSFAFPS